VDALVLEVDERYVKKVLPYITPNYFIINNLTRDQLARNGHFDLVFDDINKEIKKDTTLILNADNPLSSKFALNKENAIFYYGIERNSYSNLDYKDKIDLPYCPQCGNKIEYEYFNYGNCGSYKCTVCDFKRNKPKYEARLEENKIIIDDIIINMPNELQYSAYNLVSAYTLARLIGIEGKKVVNVLNNMNLKVKRYEKYTIGNNKLTILLSKNEVPLSYNQSLKYISRINNKKTVAIGFTRISGRYDDKDISWLYDIDFSLLNDKNIDKIILFGKYAYDLAVRLKVEHIDMSKIQLELDENETYNVLKKCKEEIYCVFYFDLEKILKKQLMENGEKEW